MSSQSGSDDRKPWSLRVHGGELDEKILVMLITEAVHMWMRGCCHMSMGSKSTSYVIEQKEMNGGHLEFRASISISGSDEVIEVGFVISEEYLKEQHTKKYRLRGEHARYNA